MAVLRSPKPQVAVRFCPPEPNFNRNYMLKLIVKWLPVVVILMTLVNMIGSYGADNMVAFNANIVALIGWLIIAAGELFNKNAIK